MNYALERNRCGEGLYSKQQAFEAWRQLIEVILASCPPELLGREVKQTMIFDLMQDLLAKVMAINDTVVSLIISVVVIFKKPLIILVRVIMVGFLW